MIDESEVVRSVEPLEGVLFPYENAVVNVDMMSLQGYFRIVIRSISYILKHFIVKPIRKMVRPVSELFSYQLTCFLRINY